MDYEALGRYTAELERVRAAQYRRNALLHNLGVAAARTAADGRRFDFAEARSLLAGAEAADAELRQATDAVNRAAERCGKPPVRVE